MEWAVGLTEKINQIVSLQVGLWTTAFSPAPGTLSWGCAVESLTDLEDAMAKLNADDMFLDAADRGALVTTGELEDETAQFIHNAVDASRNPKYVAVVRSQLNNGSFQRGVEAGVEIAQRATQLSGQPTSFLIGVTGGYGSVAWISSAESLKELEQGEQAVNMNMDFIKFLDEQASPCYIAGATTQSIWQRII